MYGAWHQVHWQGICSLINILLFLARKRELVPLHYHHFTTFPWTTMFQNILKLLLINKVFSITITLNSRAVARDGRVGGVAINFADRRAWFWVWLFLIRFLFLQPLPALALIVVHWSHFMWSKGTCARLYLAISDRYGYCELCFKNPSEIKSKVKWWKLWGYISWWESTFPVKLKSGNVIEK